MCLHCNASTSVQWRALADSLAGSHRVLAPDLYGSGKSPACPSDRLITLDDEVALIEPVLRACGEPVVLVGHSHGGAVAMMAALRYPSLVRALALYEPMLFALVDARSPPPNGVDGVRNMQAAAMAALTAGDHEAAARHFIDFWAGAGTWRAMPADRRRVIARCAVNIPHWRHSLFDEPTPLEAFASLRIPILHMLAGHSPESAHAVNRLLRSAWPHARVIEFPELGHMGPITHPGIVNAAIGGVLAPRL